MKMWTEFDVKFRTGHGPMGTLRTRFVASGQGIKIITGWLSKDNKNTNRSILYHIQYQCWWLWLLLCCWCASGWGEALWGASYRKYHIQQGWCLGRSLAFLLGLGIAGESQRMSPIGTTHMQGETYAECWTPSCVTTCTATECVSYLSWDEVSRSLWRAGEGQLLPWDHHHLGARACLVDMSGRHRPRAAALRDTPWTAVGRQTSPVGVIGLERTDGRHRHERGRGYGHGKRMWRRKQQKHEKMMQEWPQKPQRSRFGWRGEWSKSEKTIDVLLLFPF